MPLTYFHSDFLTSPDSYSAAEEYWNRLWIRAIGNTKREWTTGWVSTGSPEIRDGNPIFSALSRKLRRGVRIIQHPPTEDSNPQVVFWVDTIGGPAHSPEAVVELVVSCAPCLELEGQIASMLRAWTEGDEVVVAADIPTTRVDMSSGFELSSGAVEALRERATPFAFFGRDAFSNYLTGIAHKELRHGRD